ncbi:MAG: DUF2975 domain-containing protein [Ruminococcus sp.]|nr:DUF2975 domain-containing protein [Ruminococcus sp.]
MNKKLGKALKALVIILGVLGLGVYAVVIPWTLNTFVETYNEFSYFYMPWLVFLILTAVPLYIILGLGISVSNEISRDNTFIVKNVKSLKGVALCLVIEATYFFLGNIILWLNNLNFLGVVIASTAFCVFIVCIAAAVYILAELVKKAVEIREENESYI